MARRTPAIYTIAPGPDFCTHVVRALIEDRLLGLDFNASPLSLADLIIYVPTLRLRGEIDAAFRAYFSGRPIFLPTIRPLAEPGDPLDDIAAWPMPDVPARRIITPVERAYRLQPLVARWLTFVQAGQGDGDELPEKALPAARVAEALRFATALGLLIDETYIAGKDPAILAAALPTGYDPSRHDEYWALSRAFLAIASESWPAFLEEEQAIDASAARLAAIEAETLRLSERPARPMIVLGSTGSVAATARLMRAVSRLEHGAVILPGLDFALDDRGWAALDGEKASLATAFGHPQAVLKRTLRELGVTRDDVIPLDGEAAHSPRNRLFCEALRPSEVVEDWQKNRAEFPIADAIAGLSIIEAVDDHEEARAIALLIRRHLGEGQGRIVLMTADRTLARRVRAELARWQVDIKDSAGQRLSETPAGIFLRLVMAAAVEGSPHARLAMMRHALFSPDIEAQTGVTHPLSALVDAIELAVFRGHRFARHMPLAEQVRQVLENRPRRMAGAVGRALEESAEALPALARFVDDALSPLSAPGLATLADHSCALHKALAALTSGTSEASGRDQQAVMLALTEMETFGGAIAAGLADTVAALEDVLGARSMPEPDDPLAVALIVGPLESRLITAGKVIIGGLNEGSIPPAAADDPFLTRSMRLALGLQPPERRIGQNAHDVVMLTGTPDLVLTRARRVGGQPALPSRFLRRLEAFIGADIWKAKLQAGAGILEEAAQLDAPGRYAPVAEPMPRPAEPRLPPSLSITEMEKLIRDPYALYARHLLALDVLDPVDPEPDGRDFGTLLHACLEGIAREPLPEREEDAITRFRDIGQAVFAPFSGEPELMQFWWQRFEALFPDILRFERQRCAEAATILTECKGELVFNLPSSLRFRLSGKADRLEILPGESLAVYDFKTGVPPSAKTVLKGFAPQLPLTAAMALRGAFPSLGKPRGVANLAYIHTRPGFKTTLIAPKEEALDDFIERQWRETIDRLDRFARGAEAYRACLRPQKINDLGDYAHLARYLEWSSGVPESDDEEDDA